MGSTRRPRTLRRLAMTLAAVATIATAVWQPATTSAAPRSAAPAALAWTLVGEVPGAAAQPTADGRRIATLEAWQGRLYAGYGDWGANTGPIDVQSVDLTGGAFRTDFRADTEATHTIRAIGDKLVVPATDPRSGASDYAIATPWAAGRGIGAAHVFDATTLTGTDLWLVGSKGNKAVAWRSLDGGATWAEELVVPPSDPASYARFYFAAVLNGKLYVQAVTASAGAERGSRVFDGATWSAGPRLVGRSERGWHPVVVGSTAYLLDHGPGMAGDLFSFFGARASTELRNVTALAAAGQTVLAATSAGDLLVRTTSGRWSAIGTAPSRPVAIASSGGTVFVGTADARVFAAPLG